MDERKILELAADLDEAAGDPSRLIRHMQAFDERRAVFFSFNMDDPSRPWFWQRETVDYWLSHKRTVNLKARQIGLTWLAVAFGLWVLLFPRRGAMSLLYRQKEEDAKDLVKRAGTLLERLPAAMLNGARVERRVMEIFFHFPDGRVSEMRAMTSASTAGHGRTVAHVLSDEFAHTENAGDLVKAISSAVGEDGWWQVVSTANGVSNSETGEGNEFHRLYVNAEDAGFSARFFPYRLHPERSAPGWRDVAPEARALRPWEKLEQYPENEHEAFAGTGGAEFFDPEALFWYRSNAVREPLLRGVFETKAGSPREARFVQRPDGVVRLFERPVPGRDYAIGADVATSRGLDFSAAYVVDLVSRGFVAEVHGRLEPDVFAEQLHFLGRFFNTARIAVEVGGGYGDPVIYALRDGRAGRPAYPKLYRHRQELRGDRREHVSFGFPMGAHTRPAVLAFFGECVRERALPWVTGRLMDEMQTFVRFNPAKPSQGGTWPRARSGCHDDCVMAAAVALEMFRQHGSFEFRDRRARRRRSVAAPVSVFG